MHKTYRSRRDINAALDAMDPDHQDIHESASAMLVHRPITVQVHCRTGDDPKPDAQQDLGCHKTTFTYNIESKHEFIAHRHATSDIFRSAKKAVGCVLLCNLGNQAARQEGLTMACPARVLDSFKAGGSMYVYIFDTYVSQSKSQSLRTMISSGLPEGLPKSVYMTLRDRCKARKADLRRYA